MLIAKVENNEIKQVADYREMFPNVSWSYSTPTEEWLAENGCVAVRIFKPHDRETQNLITCAPYIEDGLVFAVTVVAKTQEEIDVGTQSKAAKVRAQRNQLLAASDWTQLLDAKVDKDAWATYRQALRDITAQPDFPLQIEWPKVPTQGE